MYRSRETMRWQQLHEWEVSPTAAVAMQKELASKIITKGSVTKCKLIAGADISFNRYSPHMHASVVLLQWPDLQPVGVANAVMHVAFPYVPGLLSFREAPALLRAFEKLREQPDLVLIDGQGIAHPRRLGLASHLGLLLDCPTIGCAKSRLIGTHAPLAVDAGASVVLEDGAETIGRVVRTKRNVKPLFVSPGHRINLTSAVKWVLACTRGYRMPEPTRVAHIQVNQLRLADQVKGPYC